ncbi:MAG TPA: lytic transglycosylase domain-containing protein [Luteibacter sp.]|jgi:type IV secretion system protein VirB1|nr:lytic transglycosylase domain-containing protein [Luteibacter sp.]
MFSGMEMMSCPDLAAPAAVMRHIVDVESGFNPYAIGVVGARLERQPQNLGEAMATARMLEAQGYNFSIGLGQVNRANLGKYGLDSYEKAFSACSNLSAASRILNECYISSGGDWGKAFSCYYSGDFVTGYRDGYVQKVYDSIGQNANAPGNMAAAIPVQLVNQQAASPSGMRGTVVNGQDSAAYRVAIRSALLDQAATMAVTAVAGHPEAPGAATAVPPQPQVGTPVAAVPAPPAPAASDDEVFVPQVRGPHDPPKAAMPAAHAPSQIAAVPVPGTDQADLRQENRDDAFVF